MRPEQKVTLLEDLISLRKRLVWAAQSRDEQLYAYNNRIQRSLEIYVKGGNIAKKQIIEISETEQERIKLGIYCYVSGVHPSVRRYMCKPEFYVTFAQARRHAEQIAYNLKDLASMRRVSVCEQRFFVSK